VTHATPPRHALGWLEQTAEFRALTDRADRMLALQSDLALCAPGRDLVALSLDDGVLLAGTPGAAAAAKLRQLEPTLVRQLGQRGWAVKRIRFKPLRVGMTAAVAPSTPREPIPAETRRALEALSEGAASERLREALRRLARRR
jgi:hypothetical protein